MQPDKSPQVHFVRPARRKQETGTREGIGVMSRKRQWQIAGALWLLVAVLLLSTCRGPDIYITEVDRDSKPVTMTVYVGPDVSKDVLLAWVSKECRDIMVLPPISPVPVQVLQRDGRHTGRKGRIEYRLKCTRP